MNNITILSLALACLAFTSCGKSESVKTDEANRKATATRNAEALESLKHIQERDARNREATEKIKNSIPPR